MKWSTTFLSLDKSYSKPRILGLHIINHRKLFEKSPSVVFPFRECLGLWMEHSIVTNQFSSQAEIKCFLFFVSLQESLSNSRLYLPSLVTQEVLQYIKFNFIVCFRWWIHWTMFTTRYSRYDDGMGKYSDKCLFLRGWTWMTADNLLQSPHQEVWENWTFCFSRQILFQTVFSYLLLDWFRVPTVHFASDFTLDGSPLLRSVWIFLWQSFSLFLSLHWSIRALPGVQPETGE